MIRQQEIVDHLTRMLERERAMKMTYFYLQTQIEEDEYRSILSQLEQDKQRHESLLEELLSAEKLRREGIFNEKLVRQLVWEHTSGRKNNSHLLWSLLCFEQWKNAL